MEPIFKPWQRDMGDVLIVKAGERETEFRAKLFEAQFRSFSLNQNIIGRFPDGGQIIYQGARPIKNDIPNHTRNVTATGIAVMNINSALKTVMSRARGQRSCRVR